MLPQLPIELVNKILITRPTHPVARLIVNAGKVDYFKRSLEEFRDLGEEAQNQIYNFEDYYEDTGSEEDLIAYLQDPTTPLKKFLIRLEELDRYYQREKDHIAGAVQSSIADFNTSTFGFDSAEDLIQFGDENAIMVDGNKCFLYKEVYTKPPPDHPLCLKGAKRKDLLAMCKRLGLRRYSKLRRKGLIALLKYSPYF